MEHREISGVERHKWLDQLEAGQTVYLDGIARNVMGDVYGGELHTILWVEERIIGLSPLTEDSTPILIAKGSGIWYGGSQMIRPVTDARKAEAAINKSRRLLEGLRVSGMEGLDVDGLLKVASIYAEELERVTEARERLYKIMKMNTGVELRRSSLSGWDAFTADGIKLVRQIPTKHKAYLAAMEECNKLARGVQEAR